MAEGPKSQTLPGLLLICWGVAIAWLSLTPAPPKISSPLLGWDKLQHASAYAVLAFVGGWAFGRTRRAFFLAFSLAILYGGVMELAQGYFTLNRTADWLDELANLTGAGVAALIGCLLFCRRKDHL